MSSLLPPQIELLAPRERQVAEIIYAEGAVTAKELQAKLHPLANSTIRAMLVRLAKKGILRQHSSNGGRGRGRGQQYFYTPGIDSDTLKIAVLEQVIEQYFDGSPVKAAKAVMELVERETRLVRPAEPEGLQRACQVRMQIKLRT